MKRLKDRIKTAAAFLVAGALFFSCTLSGTEDHGTLVVILPGGGARAAVSGTFAASLSFQLDCSGPGGNRTGRFNSGGRAAVSLIPGNWRVTVSAVNAAGEIIGSGSAAAAVTAGKTTSVQIPVTIDTSRKAITSFAVTSPVSAKGKFSLDGTGIKVYVPDGTAGTSMGFTLIHTGRSVNPAPGRPLNFSSPQTFTVTAEDSSTRTYTVTVIAIEWPAASWATYDLTGLTQPGGTALVDLEEDSIPIGSIQDDLSVTLRHITKAAYENLQAQIEGLLGYPVSAQNPGNGTRTDKFEKQAGLYTMRVRLDMDARNDTITIRADKRLLSAVFPPVWW
ncbi:MAG: DUF5018 domain-containing protein [Treponema sp.]|jgi:hypothetical protein|nr:DUF5018 domain-containing protein [Treponema sp.]